MTDRNYPMGSKGLSDEVSREVNVGMMEIIRDEELIQEVKGEITTLLQAAAILVTSHPQLSHKLIKFAADQVDYHIHGGVL